MQYAVHAGPARNQTQPNQTKNETWPPPATHGTSLNRNGEVAQSRVAGVFENADSGAGRSEDACGRVGINLHISYGFSV
jgi:hypothetical protein